MKKILHDTIYNTLFIYITRITFMMLPILCIMFCINKYLKYLIIISILFIKIVICLFKKSTDLTSIIYEKRDISTKENLSYLLHNICNFICFILCIQQATKFSLPIFLSIISNCIIIAISQIIIIYFIKFIQYFYQYNIYYQYITIFYLNKILSYSLLVYFTKIAIRTSFGYYSDTVNYYELYILNKFVLTFIIINIMCYFILLIQNLKSYRIKNIFTILYILFTIYIFYNLVKDYNTYHTVYIQILIHLMTLNFYENTLLIFVNSTFNYIYNNTNQEYINDIKQFYKYDHIIKYINTLVNCILILFVFLTYKTFIKQINFNNTMNILLTNMFIVFFILMVSYIYTVLYIRQNIQNILLKIYIILIHILIFNALLIIQKYTKHQYIFFNSLIVLNALFIILCIIGTMFNMYKKYTIINNEQNNITEQNNIKEYNIINQLVTYDYFKIYDVHISISLIYIITYFFFIIY